MVSANWNSFYFKYKIVPTIAVKGDIVDIDYLQEKSIISQAILYHYVNKGGKI